MANGDALVKHEAFAAPQALLERHGFQVFEDATFEVIDLVEALHAQKRGGLLAADAACAKHRDLGFFQPHAVQQPARLLLRGHPRRQIGKSLDVRVYCAFEAADLHLIVVASVDHHHIWVADQGVPVLRLDVNARSFCGADTGHTQRHDFFLDANLHP